VIERVTVVSTIADEMFRLGFDHVEVEAQLYEAHFLIVRGVGADRAFAERKRSSSPTQRATTL